MVKPLGPTILKFKIKYQNFVRERCTAKITISKKMASKFKRKEFNIMTKWPGFHHHHSCLVGHQGQNIDLIVHAWWPDQWAGLIIHCSKWSEIIYNAPVLHNLQGQHFRRLSIFSCPTIIYVFQHPEYRKI